MESHKEELVKEMLRDLIKAVADCTYRFDESETGTKVSVLRVENVVRLDENGQWS